MNGHLLNFKYSEKAIFQEVFPLKSRGPILRVTSSETRSVCDKQALNTRSDWSMTGHVTRFL